jgi:hypothetical protein
MAPTNARKIEREALIRRRWKDTGVTLWQQDVHGEASAPLKIEARTVRAAPARRGQPPPEPDILEFKLVRSSMTGKPVDRIICEGVVVAVNHALWPPRGENR